MSTSGTNPIVTLCLSDKHLKFKLEPLKTSYLLLILLFLFRVKINKNPVHYSITKMHTLSTKKKKLRCTLYSWTHKSSRKQLSIKLRSDNVFSFCSLPLLNLLDSESKTTYDKQPWNQSLLHQVRLTN